MADTVELEIKTQTDDAIKAIKALEDAAGNMTKALGGSAQKLEEQEKASKSLATSSQKSLITISDGWDLVKKAAAAAVAYFSAKAVFDFFKEGIDAANKQEAALAKLQYQLDLTGGASEDAKKTFLDLADELEKTTKYEDDVILSTAAMAKSFGVSNEQAIQMTKAATELSAVTGKGLEESIRSLGKTLNGTAGEIADQVPELKKLTKEQLAAGDAANVIIKVLGGSAAAEIKTFGGAVGQAGKAFGNFGESFGDIVVKSPVVISAVNTITDILALLQKEVEDNKDDIKDFVNTAVKSMVVAIPLATDAFNYFLLALGQTTKYASLAVAGLGEVTGFFLRVWNATIGLAVDTFLSFLETISKSVTKIPLVSKAFEAMGVDISGVSDTIGEFRKAFNTTVDKGIQGLGSLRDGAITFADGAEKSFDSASKYVADFSTKVEGLTQKVFESDNAQVDSSKKVTAARAKVTREIQGQAEEFKRLQEEAKKFGDELLKSTLDEYDKLAQEADEQQAKIDEFRKKEVIGAEEAARLKLLVEENFHKKEIELTEKAAKEAAAKIQGITNMPFKFVIDTVFEQTLEEAADNTSLFNRVKASAQEFSSEIATGAGFLQKALNGKAGASSLISEAAGALGDAILPGIGGAVSGIVGVLAQGPDVVKAQIKGFIEAIPDIITAIAESIPVVVEALVDTLINKGGIIKIAVALAKALAGEAIFKNIGRQLGIDAGEAFQAKNIGATISGAFKAAADEASQLTKQRIIEGFQGISRTLLIDFPSKMSNILFVQLPGVLQNGAQVIGTAILSAFTGGIEAISTFVQNLPTALSAGVESLVNGFSNALQSAGASISNLIGQSGVDFANGVKQAIGGVFGPILDAFRSFKFPALPKFTFPSLPKFTFPDFPPIRLPDFPEIPTPGWIKDLQNALGAGGGGGGGNVITKALGKVGIKLPGAAEGGVVPPGFPQDSYPAFLTSGEGVLTPQQTSQLGRLLQALEGQTAAAGVGGSGQVLQITLKVGEQELSKVLVNLNRQGFRTA